MPPQFSDFRLRSSGQASSSSWEPSPQQSGLPPEDQEHASAWSNVRITEIVGPKAPPPGLPERPTRGSSVDRMVPKSPPMGLRPHPVMSEQAQDGQTGATEQGTAPARRWNKGFGRSPLPDPPPRRTIYLTTSLDLSAPLCQLWWDLSVQQNGWEEWTLTWLTLEGEDP